MRPGGKRVRLLGLVIYLVACGVLLDEGLATAFVRADMYDYLCFHGGAVGLLRGINYYDAANASTIAAEFGKTRFLNVYPPLSSLFFVPLALLPWEIAKRVWATISLVALLVFVRLLSPWFLGDLRGPTRVIWGAVGALLLASFYSLGHSLQVGQTTVLNAALIMGVLTLAARHRDLQAGGLLALAVFFKPTAVVVMLYALLKRRWRLVAYTVLGIVLLTVISVAVLGTDIHIDYLEHILWYLDRVDYGVNYQDFAAFWGRLFAWEGRSPFPGNEHLVKPLTWAAAAALMLPVLILLVRKRWEELSPAAHLAEFGLLFTAVLLAQNQSAIHAYFLLAIPMAAAAVYVRELEPGGRRFWWLAGGLAAAYCLVALPFGFREEALWHGLLMLAVSSKLYGGLLLWGVLLWIVWHEFEGRDATAATADEGVGSDHTPEAVEDEAAADRAGGRSLPHNCAIIPVGITHGSQHTEVAGGAQCLRQSSSMRCARPSGASAAG